MSKKRKRTLSKARILLYKENSKTIKFLRRNPVLACEKLLGIRLMDSQKWILQEAWNKPNVCIAASRNYGKSFLFAIFMILKAILYENQSIYIVSSVGSQAKETFMKIEEIVKRVGKTAESIRSLKDIAKNETVKHASNPTGFSHPADGFVVKFYNGSEIHTLNGKPDNNRSKRATLVFFDEAGFSSDEQIMVAEAFATQNSEFVTSTDDEFDIRTEKSKTPTQLIYASSASSIDRMFWTKYKDFAKKMFLGDQNYFCADISCTIPISPMMDGEPYQPLLTQEKVDNAMRADPEKARREYYNIFQSDGGANQMIKNAWISRNEILHIPEFSNPDGKTKYVIAFDPARTIDNSVVTVMKVVDDPDIGYYGEIVNVTNLVELANKKGYKMTSPKQIEFLRNTILNYNGNGSYGVADYENIMAFLVDPGAGGGGVSAYGDNLLEAWRDKAGREHKGFIDRESDVYSDIAKNYPNASNILRFLSPNKYRNDMAKALEEMMELDLIKFAQSYDGRDYITYEEKVKGKDDEVQLTKRMLSVEEQVALANIELLKRETTTIQKITNPEGTSVSYKLPKDKEASMHDDRFYTLIMLAYYLKEIRRRDIVNKKAKSKSWANYVYW